LDPSQRNTDRSLHVPWTLRDIVLAGLTTVGLLIAGIFALAVVVVVLTVAGIEVLPDADIAALSTPLLMGVFVLMEGLFLIPPWLFGPHRYGGGWGILGLRPFSVGKGLGLVVLAFGLILAITAGWDWLNRTYFQLPSQPDVLPLFGEGIGGLLTALVGAGVVAAVAEEVLFRGFVHAGLRSRWGTGWALVVSSAAFAVVHVYAGAVPPIFAMGVVLGLLYELTGSVWPCILLHGAWNSFGLIAVYIAERLPDLLA